MYRLMLGCTGTQGEIRWRGVSMLITIWVASGLLVASACSAFTASSPVLGRLARGEGFVFLLLLLPQLGVAIAINAMIGRFAAWQAIILFVMYSFLNGLSLSGLFLAVSHLSLTATFLILAMVFGLLSIYGLLTRRDLTRPDGLVVLGMLGVVLATCVHLLLHSPLALWIVSYLSIAISICLIISDTQKMKHMDVRADDLRASRLAILGALVLTVDGLLGIARLCVALLQAYAEGYARYNPDGGYFPLGFYESSLGR